MSLGRPVVKSTVMDDEMCQFAIMQAQVSLEKANSEKEAASLVKNEMEKKYKSVWHCIVGRNFAGYVTHELGRYIYFYIGQRGFMIFSTPS